MFKLKKKKKKKKKSGAREIHGKRKQTLSFFKYTIILPSIRPQLFASWSFNFPFPSVAWYRLRNKISKQIRTRKLVRN